MKENVFLKMTQIANQATQNAQEENRRLGIPNVYSINGIVVYEYKGKVSMTPPRCWRNFDPSKGTCPATTRQTP